MKNTISKIVVTRTTIILAAIFVLQTGMCKTANAQSTAVSIVEPGKTPGFSPPILNLNTDLIEEKLLPLINQNRTTQPPHLINFNPQRGDFFSPITEDFLEQLVDEQGAAFNLLIDPYDETDQPGNGYSWELKLFHPGNTVGILEQSEEKYPLIIFCAGAQKNSPDLYSAMDWLGNYYAEQGYIVALPTLIGNDNDLYSIDYYEIAVDIFAYQVTQTIDYVAAHFDNNTDTDQVTLFGHSLGGFASLKAAAADSRITRLGLLSAAFVWQPFWPGFLIDSVDTFDLLNALPKDRQPALHVQRFTRPPYFLPCPSYDPECDWIPPIDGFITRVNLTRDPWEPHLCDGESCGRQTGSLYYHVLYEGEKESSIRSNNLLDHNAIYDNATKNDEGKALLLEYLDTFFEAFPLR